jgi:dUTP pyrophosphatase
MKTIMVKIMRMPGTQDVPLPKYQSDGAVGMDLHAAVEADVKMEPGTVSAIPCGFAMALPSGYEAQIRPRSGLAAKNGISLVNTPGTIDPDYRGEVKVLLINHGKDPFTVTRGMRIAQMVVLPVPRVEWMISDKLPETKRGAGGFGHTGQ